MKAIAITGGKGGVGKSTMAVLLAQELSKREKTILVDADVECPNDYLLLGKKLSVPVKKIFAHFPQLIRKKCRRCGLCARKCRFHAIFAPFGKYPIFLHELCSNCGLCWHICPFGAIRPKKKQRGEVFENRISRNLLLLTGRTKGVIEESGPVVNQLKKYAFKKAEQWGAKKLIIDTAAGTHCSVIQALLEVDEVLAVTEPTPLGRYDLELILSLTSKLGLATRVIINQFDLGEEKEVLVVIKKFGASVAGRVPYSRELARAYSQGKLVNFAFLNRYGLSA
jgi:MinD superfamily P-loop ATPase